MLYFPKGPVSGFGGGGWGDYFAFNLHINGVNSRPGRSLWNLPGSCSLLCGFPTCLRASWLPVVWPRWGRGVGVRVGVRMVATGFPRTNKGPSCPPPGPTGLPAAGCPGGLPEAWWKAPGWLMASHRSASPRAGNPAGVPRALPCLRGWREGSLHPYPPRPLQRPGPGRQWAGKGLSPPTGAK